jgi:peptidyl-prolyl cis-trans isomerase D
MAVLEKMREKSGTIFIGLAVAFLLMIVFEWGAQGDFFRGGRTGNELGEVNGYKIQSSEYEQVFQQLREQKLADTKKKSLSDEEEEALRDEAWEQLVINKLVEQKIDEYDINVTDQEIRELVYYNPPSFLKRGFIDSTGKFLEQEYFQAVRDPRNDTIISSYIVPLRDEMRRIKLQGYIQALSRITNGEMWERYDVQNSKAVAQVVKIMPTGDESQFLSKVTDDEIKKYYESHQYEFKRQESKKIKFVLFREQPTAKDSALLMDRFQTLRKRWSALPVSEPDSTVAELASDYSDDPYLGVQPFDMASQRGVMNAGDVINANVGDIVMLRGAGTISAVRIHSVFDTGGAKFNSRHILIKKVKGATSDSARSLAQQLYAQLKAGASFADLARRYSNDGSAQNGGELGWASKNMFVPEFEKVVLTAPIRVVQPPVETEFGFHIIEVLDRTTKTVNVSTITMPVRTSSQTASLIRQQARLFKEKATNLGFDAAAKEMNLRVIADAPPVTKSSQPIFNNISFVNYVMGLSKGDITEPVKIDAVKGIIVAEVIEVIAKGVNPLDDNIKSGIKQKIAKRKLIESLQPKAKELRALVGPGEGVDKIALQDSNYKPIMLSFGPAESVSGLGTEYAVNTTAFRMKPGEVSEPIKGENGYYIVQLIALNPASKQTFEAQKTQLYENLNQEKQQRFFSEWFQKLKENANILDYRTGMR